MSVTLATHCFEVDLRVMICDDCRRMHSWCRCSVKFLECLTWWYLVMSRHLFLKISKWKRQSQMWCLSLHVRHCKTLAERPSLWKKCSLSAGVRGESFDAAISYGVSEESLLWSLQVSHFEYVWQCFTWTFRTLLIFCCWCCLAISGSFAWWEASRMWSHRTPVCSGAKRQAVLFGTLFGAFDRAIWGDYACCSALGWCGNSKQHCSCKGVGTVASYMSNADHMIRHVKISKINRSCNFLTLET